MGNIHDILEAVETKALALLKTDGILNTSLHIPHTGGEHLIVGETYEMRGEEAKGSTTALGIQWHNKDYSFVYAGTVEVLGELYICTKDIHYEGKVVPDTVLHSFEVLRERLGGVSALCPAYIALSLIRPVTG